MPTPTLTATQRSIGAAQAVAARRHRADIKGQLKAGRLSLREVIAAVPEDPVLARLTVADVLAALPGVGPRTAARLMEDVQIAPSRRLRGLGPHQIHALLDRCEVR